MAEPIDILRDALFGNPPSTAFKPSREGVLAAFTRLKLTTEAGIAAAALSGTNLTAAMALVAPLLQSSLAAQAALETALQAIPVSVAAQLRVAIDTATEEANAARDDANDSRDAAQLAAATALAASRYFPSRSAGEAASTTDQLFTTDDGAGVLIYYRRTAGGSAEIGRAVTPARLAGPNAASAIGTSDGDLQSVLDARKPVTVILARYAIEMNDDAAWTRALAAVTAAGGGTIQLPARDIITTQAWFVPSNVEVLGQGDVSAVVFAGPNPAVMSGSGSNPRWGNLRSSALVIAGHNPDDMLPGAYSDNQTGDYATTALRPFTDATSLMSGATSFVAPAGTANDISPGDFLYFERGIIGWHTAVHEMVQVAARTGDTVTLTKPVRYSYAGSAADPFNDFMDKFAYSGGPPPGVDGTAFSAWRQCGWRKVVPVVNAAVRNLSVRTTTTFAGYANLAIGIFRAFNCTVENVTVQGGGVWNIDSHGTTFLKPRFDRINGAYPATDFLPGNGSTATVITDLYMKGGNLDIEEGACDIRITGKTFGHVFVNQFCRDVSLDGLDASFDTGYALRVLTSAQVLARGAFVSPQPAVQFGTKNLFKMFPGATLAHWKAVNEYFEGATFRLLPGSYVYSTANNSLDIYGEQSVVADGVEVGGATGDFYSIPDSSYGFVVGMMRRRQDGLRAGSPHQTGKPTFYPVSPAQTAYDSTNDRAYAIVNVNMKTAANVTDASNFTVNAPTTAGGVKAGDVARILIENTATVTGADGASYTANNARAWHYSVVQAVNTDTSVVTLATAVPANWAVKLGTDGAQYFARWG